MHSNELIGIGAGLCTTLSFLPQVFKSYKIMRHHKKSDLSIGFLIVFITGLVLWALYGVRLYIKTKNSQKRDGVSIIITNISTLILVLIVFVFTLKK
jgi:MtN3 and saliva related transmembrane protein